MHKVERSLLFAGLCAIAAMPALAGPTIPEDPRIDSNGRLVATWPKDRLFDHLHMRLELDIPDINKPYLSALETLEVSPLGIGRGQITLDCDGPKVQSVTLDGQGASFSQADRKLNIVFPRMVPVGQKATLAIQYSLEFDHGGGQGLTFSQAKEDGSSLTTRSTQIHAQGEAELNSRWFPCLDHPSEKLTTELIVTVEDGYEVVSNGHLVSKTATNPPGRTRWHWLQDKPHSNYLVTLVVGKLAVVDVGGPDTARPGLAMPVYTPIGTEENVKTSFANTPEMIAFFEKTFGVAYPWDKYAQVLVRDFAAGGMENTSCTLLTVGSSRARERGSQDSLISHELAHQWFGDLVTCRSWDHLWLNEGWATYCEALWDEHKGAMQSPEKARSAYERNFRHRRGTGGLSAPETPAIVSNRFKNPDAVFMKSDNPYGKGAALLNMLRSRLGEETFYKGVKTYLERYQYSTAETDDFRRVMEEVSGESLERFFAQWFDRPGRPQLEVDLNWDQKAGELSVAVEQGQTIDGLNPAYAFTIPVFVQLPDKSTRWVFIDMDTRAASATVKLPAKPEQVSVDPHNTIYCGLGVRKELAMWIEEAAHGPTVSAQLDAVDYLKELDSQEAKTALAALAANERLDGEVRAAASASLASVSDR
jgi:aminopeptidase N